MKNINWFLFLIAALNILTACNKSDEPEIKIDPDNLLIGVWVNSQYTDTAIIMARSQHFIDTCDGYEFKADGTLIQRANSGWCGTPPISYSNYNGTWVKMPDKTIFIETENWDGSFSYYLEIIEVNKTQLKFKQVIKLN